MDPNTPGQANPGAGDPNSPPAPGGGQPGGQPQPGGAATEVLTIDGAQYTADQVKELLKAKADYDQLQPEFTRKSQLLTNPDRLLEHARQQWPDRFPAAPAAPATPEQEQKQQALETLASLGVITKDQAIELAKKTAEDLIAQRDADAFVKSEREKLEKEWDGAEGKPKFDFAQVAKHAVENGFPNLTSAFRDLHHDALLEWHAAHKSQPKAPVIAAPGGGGVPVQKDKPMRLDSPEFDQAADEILGGG